MSIKTEMLTICWYYIISIYKHTMAPSHAYVEVQFSAWILYINYCYIAFKSTLSWVYAIQKRGRGGWVGEKKRELGYESSKCNRKLMKISNHGDDMEWATGPDKKGTNFILSFITLTFNCTIRKYACEVVIRIYITTEIHKVIFQCQLHGIAWCKACININIEKGFIYSIANSPKNNCVSATRDKNDKTKCVFHSTNDTVVVCVHIYIVTNVH